MGATEVTAGVFNITDKLGSGGHAHVFKATSGTEFGGVVALKKARVPLRLKRPPLKYEALILQLLQGDPAIPKLYAYGRFEHFEYIAMELLGSSLGDLQETHGVFPLKTIFLVTDQLISALAYIHRHGIVHRDIKPDNIMQSLDNPGRICIIDYGIARPLNTGPPGRHDPHVERTNLMGTIHWASLNAHYGLDLSRRDDLESLAYTLLFFLRGDLPWRRLSKCLGATIFGTMAQVREKKRAWSGFRLTLGHPPEFGQFLDYARNLGFDDAPDYDKWRLKFQELYDGLEYDKDNILEWTADDADKPPPFVYTHRSVDLSVVKTGEIVYVQLLARMTMEGYTGRAGDTSYWNDPDLSTEHWETKARPAIVLQVSRFGVRVIPITRDQAAGLELNGVKITNSVSENDENTVFLPDWPFGATFAYAFPRPILIFPRPELVPVRSNWRVSEEGVRLLLNKLDHGSDVLLSREDMQKYERLRGGMDRPYTYSLYAEITSIGLETITSPFPGDPNIDWDGRRGWFDELMKIDEKRRIDDAWVTGDKVNLESSYSAWDFDSWDGIHQERNRSLTLDAKEVAQLNDKFGPISQVISRFWTSVTE